MKTDGRRETWLKRNARWLDAGLLREFGRLVPEELFRMLQEIERETTPEAAAIRSAFNRKIPGGTGSVTVSLRRFYKRVLAAELRHARGEAARHRCLFGAASEPAIRREATRALRKRDQADLAFLLRHVLGEPVTALARERQLRGAARGLTRQHVDQRAYAAVWGAARRAYVRHVAEVLAARDRLVMAADAARLARAQSAARERELEDARRSYRALGRVKKTS